MLDVLFQHILLYAVAEVAWRVIFFFGGVVAVAVYIFVLVHVRAYEICKEVINGIFSANA